MYSRKVIILIGIGGFISVLAWKTGIGLFYFLAAFVFSLIIASLSFIIAQLYIGSIELHRSMRSAAVEDDSLDIEIFISNRSSLPKHYLLLEDLFPAGAVEKRQRQLLEVVKGRQAVRLIYKQKCFKRGLYRIGPITVSFSDPLGIFFKSKRYNLYSQLIVYPKMFKIRRFPSLVKGSASWFGISTRRASGDESEFFGIREYKPGDPMKRIHWRSTARLRTLVVKEYEHYASYNISIILDLMESSNMGFGKETTLEYSIKIASSIAKHLIEQGALIQLIAHGREPVMFAFNKGEFHLEEILKFLATTEAEGHVPLTELLSVNSAAIPSYSTLVLIMNDNDSDTLVNIAELKARDVSVIPVVLQTSSFLHSEEPQALKSQKARLENLGVNSYFISREDNLEDKFSQVLDRF